MAYLGLDLTRWVGCHFDSNQQAGTGPVQFYKFTYTLYDYREECSYECLETYLVYDII